jgi:hypothetical protein
VLEELTDRAFADFDDPGPVWVRSAHTILSGG